MNNPIPTVDLWEKDHAQQWKEWVEREIMSTDYETLEVAMKCIMTKSKGKMNPVFIKEAYTGLMK